MEPVPEEEDPFQTKVLSVLENYCLDCHSGDEPYGNVSLDKFTTQEEALKNGKLWFQVLDAVETRMMPPEDMPQLEDEEVSSVVQWVEKDYLAARCTSDGEIAPIVLRRLNRNEYNNTIRDLFGINLRPADDFPADETAFGYDNVSASQTLSPTHIEKYLIAAEKVMQAVIAVPDIEQLPIIEPLNPVSAGSLVATQAPIELSYPLQANARYVLEFALKVDEKEAPQIKVEVAGQSRTVLPEMVGEDGIAFYSVWLRPTASESSVQITAVTEDSNSSFPFTGDLLELRGPWIAEPSPVQQRVICCEPTGDPETRLQCARSIIESFATKAFRRPLKDGELDPLMALFELAESRGESFERSIQVALGSALVSPQFLFLVESHPDGNKGQPLNDYELASRLSYFLWSSMPDDVLLERAKQGTLRENLRSEVDRMMADPKSNAFIRNFAGQWLQTRRLDGVNPDPVQFMIFDNELRQSMKEETERYFEYIVREDRNILELLDSDYTFINQRLADHYGLDVDFDESNSSEFKKVSLEGLPRGGVLTHASVLTITSNPNRTSPVKRGQWVLQQLLGTPPPPPPPDAGNLDESPQAMESATLRERLSAHRDKPQCASCHNRMDPLGFAMENFDPIGRWRVLDGEFSIDPAGELTDGRAFEDADDLRMLLRDEPKRFVRTMSRNLMMYAIGRGLDERDWCEIEQIRQEMIENDYRFSTMLYAVVESRQFQTRGTTPPEPKDDGRGRRRWRN